MDINSLYNISSDVIRNNYRGSIGQSSEVEGKDAFSSFFQAAAESIKTTNSYISDAEDEEIKLALGETESTHDLTIALQKASTAISYTVAVRDKFLEAYNSIMQMQI